MDPGFSNRISMWLRESLLVDQASPETRAKIEAECEKVNVQLDPFHGDFDRQEIELLAMLLCCPASFSHVVNVVFVLVGSLLVPLVPIGSDWFLCFSFRVYICFSNR